MGGMPWPKNRHNSLPCTVRTSKDKGCAIVVVCYLTYSRVCLDRKGQIWLPLVILTVELSVKGGELIYSPPEKKKKKLKSLDVLAECHKNQPRPFDVIDAIIFILS